MGTSAVQDDPMLRLKYYKETGQTDEAAKYEHYLRDTGQFKDTADPHLHARDVARRMTSANEAEAAAVPSQMSTALGGISALLKSVPGGEAAQAGARSLVSRILRGPTQDYRTALQDIRGAEDDNPASGFNNIAGGTLAALATPGGPALGGARYGILSGLGTADPSSVEDRLHSAAKQGAAGAAFGKGAEWLTTLGRTIAARTGGQAAMDMKAAMKAADDVAYGKAAEEGAGHHGPLTPAFGKEDTAPYIETIRKSRQFGNADDATVLREAYKLMSEHQGKLANTMANASDFKAGTKFGADEARLAKEELLGASDQVMPSFRAANAQHAAMAAGRDAFRVAADATKRIASGAAPAAKNLETKSPEAFKAAIGKMTPAQALDALDGLFGRLKSQTSVTANPLKLFGIPSDAAKVAKMAPYVRALDKQAGTTALPSLWQRNLTAYGMSGLFGNNQ